VRLGRPWLGSRDQEEAQLACSRRPEAAQLRTALGSSQGTQEAPQSQEPQAAPPQSRQAQAAPQSQEPQAARQSLEPQAAAPQSLEPQAAPHSLELQAVALPEGAAALLNYCGSPASVCSHS
jgi:hypothetical protein